MDPLGLFLAARERAQGHGFHIDTDADPLFERMADKLLEAAQVRALLRFKPQDHFILASFFGKRYHVFAAHAFHALQQDIDLAWVNVDPVSYTHLDVYKRQIHDLPFRDRLTAAHHTPIGRIFPDQRVLLFKGHFIHAQHPAFPLELRLPVQGETCLLYTSRCV